MTTRLAAAAVPSSKAQVDDYYRDGTRLLRVHAFTDDRLQVCLEDAYAYQPGPVACVGETPLPSRARYKVEWRPTELLGELELVRRRRPQVETPVTT